MIDYLWLLIVLPLLGAATLIVFGKRIGEPWAGWLASALVGAAFLLAAGFTVPLLTGDGQPETVELFSWIPVLGVDASLLWDPLAAFMTLIVTGVGLLIHVYAVGYMHRDERFGRFFGYLNLFIASMLTLVLASNFAVMFVGWELVGLSSYLLISFWFVRPAAAAAGKKAFIVNRIGDWGFLVGLMLIFAAFGTFSFGAIFETAPDVLSTAMATAITLALFIGAVGKSAQIPLYVWLPDAMEGPTPVSALIHAATMVTAGIYMMARSAVLFELAPATLVVVATVGAVTALYAATLAMGQRDIKRVLAYSTISQLGYMVLAVGVTAFTAGLFHLMTHAFFKALLFLGAGAVIHALGGEQDMRKMGGLRKVMPITFWTMVVGWLAISGVAPLSGFWSKDEVLAAAFAHGTYYVVLWAMGVVAALLTAFYMTRLMILTFGGEERWPDGADPHEAPKVVTVPLVVLAVFAGLAGVINTPFRESLEHFLEPSFEGVTQQSPAEGPTVVVLALVALIAALVGIFIAWGRYSKKVPEERGGYWKAARNGYGVDDWYGRLVVAPGKAMATWAGETLDGRIVDGLVNGVGGSVKSLGNSLSGSQSGWVRWYGAVMAASTLGVLLWLLLSGGLF
ncbi:MAG: NADH-quinone oxidoreductase subunit L [Acidimicrobiia bacterium]|nr:MAG: NADH-quinone oxidoreductase subunit L [Acidimicrobiia bacterium]